MKVDRKRGGDAEPNGVPAPPPFEQSYWEPVETKASAAIPTNAMTSINAIRARLTTTRNRETRSVNIRPRLRKDQRSRTTTRAAGRTAKLVTKWPCRVTVCIAVTSCLEADRLP